MVVPETSAGNIRTPRVANTDSGQGEHEEADRLYVRAIEAHETVLGPDYPDVATMLDNRAGLLQQQV